MSIPSRETCYRIMIGMAMPDHIVAHSLQVCRTALLLASSRSAVNGRLNLALVEASALLHDITKSRSIQTGEDHALTGEAYLAELGHADVAYIVGRHVRLDETFSSKAVTEAEIVNYADKRVVHDRIVSLEERMEYLLERYGTDEQRRGWIRMLAEKSREMECRIFLGLAFTPADLEKMLVPDDRLREFLSCR